METSSGTLMRHYSMMEETTRKPASFATQSGALMRKNIIIQKRNMRVNVLLILFPALVCLLLFSLRTCLDKLREPLPQTMNEMLKNPQKNPVLLQIPDPAYRATRGNNSYKPNYYPDLPLNTCRAEGTCPVSILLTGMNQTLAERLGKNLYGSETLSELSDSLDAQTMASKFIVGTYTREQMKRLCIVRPKCKEDSMLSIKADITVIQKGMECVEGLLLWRQKSIDIARELSTGFQKGNSEGRIDEFLTAFDFLNTNGSIFNATVWYNVTDNESIRNLRAANLASNSYLEYSGGAHVQMLFEFVKNTPNEELLPISTAMAMISQMGTLLFAWVIQSLLPIMLTSLVYEKQNNLRMIMKMHGLGDFPYWLINYAYFLLISFAYMLTLVIFGSILGLQIFVLNDYSVQFVFYFLYINLQIAFAFVMSTLFSDVKTASVFGHIYVFITGLAGFCILTMKSSIAKRLLQALEMIPCFSLSRGLYELARYSTEAMYLGSIQSNWKAILTDKEGILFVSIVMIVEWPVLLLIAYYLDQVGSNGSGVRRHPLWFLSRFQRKPKSCEPKQGCDILVNVEKQDVSQEREQVKKLVQEPSESHVMVCDDLKKTYPPRDGNPVKHAVRGLSLAIPKGECFGMLGPNGAGKSSFISMMTGLTIPTSGAAIISGLDIKTDMDKAYPRMGVCPQHDLIWENLTGSEHLLFYGRLKNLRGVELMQAVEESLESVKLLDKRDTRVGRYSGGMKRRLSVAISLIGNPKVVYLDEPSTGLDPASRKSLWNAVQCAKKDKAIILTTHSMEEAEFLCDRVGIFVDGSLQCIGNPKQLRARYGGYFMLTVTTPPSQDVDVENFVHLLSPSSRKVYQLSGTQKFHIPKGEVKLADIFREVDNAKKRIDIQNWGLADATLEEVFIHVAKDAISIS